MEVYGRGVTVQPGQPERYKDKKDYQRGGCKRKIRILVLGKLILKGLSDIQMIIPNRKQDIIFEFREKMRLKIKFENH